MNSRPRGQILIIFALGIFVLVGIVAMVVDVSWYWSNSLRIQRAADAAALAGVVYLPGDVPKATSAALAESVKNGYTSITTPPASCPVGSTCVYPAQDPANPRRMVVTISAPINTFFMRIFGFTRITTNRTSKAEYVLPVPMGSPQNYYGVYGKLRTPSNTTGTQQLLSDGTTPTNQGFWGTMISQGASRTNGDAYLAKYNCSSTCSTLNPDYKPSTYYDYGIEMAAGSTGGSVRIFDPVFCATDTTAAFGTGDRWFNGSTNATSAFFDLYDTNNTPYDLTDDTLVATAKKSTDANGVSGTFFRNVQAADSTLFSPSSNSPSGVPTCTQGASGITNSDPRWYHNRWYTLPFQPGATMRGFDDSGNAAIRTYRLRTTSTDPASPSAQDNADGHNSFSIEAETTSGADPKVFGYGSMEAFSPLPQGQVSTFFLAQIASIHAGKTVTIDLWDPGDTGNLSASLEILEPIVGSGSNPCPSGVTKCWKPMQFSYTAEQLGAGGSSCNSLTGTNVSSVTTNTGGSSRFNGCWLHITAKLAATYSAPVPDASQWPSDLPASARGPGWFRIRYTMGSGSGNAFDLTTWQVGIRGNPVHLVVN